MMGSTVKSVKKFKKVIGLVAAVLTLGACSSNNSEDTYMARDVNTLYHLAVGRLEVSQFGLAAGIFDEIERQHPYSEWARRAQLMAAYTYYLANEYDDAILASERFLQLHPGNTSAPYAHYLIALCHYEQITDVGRDQKVTRAAMTALENVVRRYPETDYAKDAKLKLHMTQDHLAGKDMAVGRFYQGKGQWLAGIRRFKNVIDVFQTTSHTPEALHRLVESYLALGVEEEALKTAAILGYNYPKSKWYRFTYNLLAKEGLATKIIPKTASNEDQERKSFLSKIF
jgi:outer membrane protein assembly factor BamD